MNTITIDFTKTVGGMKIMHAVNNGPSKGRKDQARSNFDTYKAARIPYARTHDAAFCSAYGGEHTVDVANIFRDFDADADDPASYDFILTDEYLETIFAAGTEPFFRLGAKIEHEIKKYNTLPPKDFHKWAVICEHIIRHYTEGWADGKTWNIRYWEIWNEPDGAADDADYYDKKCWGGTAAQFYEFYAVAAKHLKSCFPHLMIGGPSLCWQYRTGWVDNFLQYLADNDVPLDFFSWHVYTHRPDFIADTSVHLRKLLDKYGFEKAESILNEWNYVGHWDERFVRTAEMISNMHGAAFVSACMAVSQNEPIDMLMYYDARIGTVFNGMFDLYTLQPRKAYYPFTVFADLYELGKQVEVSIDAEELYAVAASDGKKNAAMITRYLPEAELRDDLMPIRVVLKGVNAEAEVTVSILDENRTMEAHTIRLVDGAFTVSMKSAAMIRIQA